MIAALDKDNKIEAIVAKKANHPNLDNNTWLFL